MENRLVVGESRQQTTIGRRPVEDSDADFLLSVYASTREEEMALVDWSDAEKEAFLRNQLAAQKAAYDTRFPHAAHDIILVEGREAGQIWIHRGEGEIRLLDIALLPQYRRRGIGSVLLQELQDEATRSEKPLRHCVYKTNMPALAFYRRLGFAVIDDLGMYHEMEWNPPATIRKKGK